MRSESSVFQVEHEPDHLAGVPSHEGFLPGKEDKVADFKAPSNSEILGSPALCSAKGPPKHFSPLLPPA